MSKTFKVADYDIIYLSFDEPNAEKNYADLCKKVGIKELKKNDYSLTPGRYVGVNPQVSKELNNLDRINEIQNELKELNTQSSKLMNEIQKIKL